MNDLHCSTSLLHFATLFVPHATSDMHNATPLVTYCTPQMHSIPPLLMYVTTDMHNVPPLVTYVIKAYFQQKVAVFSCFDKNTGLTRVSNSNSPSTHPRLISSLPNWPTSFGKLLAVLRRICFGFR